MVIVGHCFGFGGYGKDPLQVLTNNQVALGRWPVDIFFVLSGFLLSGSLERTSLAKFAISRALRIYPALWVCLIISGLFLPIAFGVAPSFWYIARCAPLLFGVEGIIPGLFTANPIHEVNPALWTLPFELYCYITLPVAFAAFGRNNSWLAAPLFILITATFWLQIYTSTSAWDNAAISSPIRLACFFYAGVGLYVFRYRVIISNALAAVCAIVLIGATVLGRYTFHHGGGLFYVVAPVALSYLTMYFAVRLPFTKLNNEIGNGVKIDISYGVYIYGSIVLQCLTSSGLGFGTLPVLVYLALAVLITYLIATASWFLIEQPALKLKSRNGNTSVPAPVLTAGAP